MKELPLMPTLTVKVKREPGSTAENAPWTVKTVPVKTEVKREPGSSTVKPEPGADEVEPVRRDAVKPEKVEDVRVVPAVPEGAAPWSRPEVIVSHSKPAAPPALPPPAPHEDDQEMPRKRIDPRWTKPLRDRKKPRNAPDSTEFSTSLLRTANYTAVDPSREVYGLIDRGLTDPGTRALIMHIRPRKDARAVLETVRPGALLPAISKSGRGGRSFLRVRYTTPTKYFSPGCKVSSMTVGVDEADWQSLVTKAHRI